MAIEQIYTPAGGLLEVHGMTREDVSDKVRNVIVPYWEDYCDAHWLSPNHEDKLCPERRVKAFLDRCGTLMLFGLPGIETRYKEMARKVREIPMSDCPQPIRNCIYGGKPLPNDKAILAEEESRFETLMDRTINGTLAKDVQRDVHKDMPPAKPRKRQRPADTRFKRAEEIRKQYPKAAITICTVTTDGAFQYRDKDYSVAEFPEYKSILTPRGEYYAMDRVTIVDTGVLIRVYDQNLCFLTERPK